MKTSIRCKPGCFAGKIVPSAGTAWPRELLWAFYSSHITNTIVNNLKLAETFFWILRLKRRIERDPLHRSYVDMALTPVVDEDDATLDLLTKTTGAKAAIDHFKKVAALTH